MDNKGYLSEEKYQKNKKKIVVIALIVLILGLLIGGSLIAIGLMKQGETNSKYSEDSKANLTGQVEAEKQNLIQSRTQLEEKVEPVQEEIKKLEREEFVGFDDDYYARKDRIEELERSISADQKSINTINEALNGSFNYCAFDDAKSNTYTSKYCSLKNQLEDVSNDFNKDFDSFDSVPFYMFGAFIIIASCMISGSIYVFAKRREITAFTAQQVMPVAKEGIDKMAPTLGNAAKEITKGVKDGIKNDEK